jgi:hypothetical protein
MHLGYENSPVWDILKYIAGSSDLAGVIGYDFRIAPDGLFEFFPKNSKTSSVSLSEKIEVSEYRKDILRIRNKITIYGLADKSVPVDKDTWTESLTPTDGNWYEVSGTTSFDTVTKKKGTGSIKTYAANLYYAACRFVLNAGKEVNSNLYPLLNFWVRRESSFNGNVNVILYDITEKSASHMFNIGAGEWFQRDFKVGVGNADVWDVESGFDWTQIKIIRFDCWFTGSGTGSFWVDGLFFGGRRYSAIREDTTSQNNYGLRELVEVDEELVSDNECDLRAKSLLDYFKNPAEYLTVRSTVIDYGNTPLLAGDKIHVTLPNENVDSDFRIESVEYRVDAKTQTLEITLELGKVPPMLADYLYGLRATTVTVEKLARTKLGKGMGAVGGGGWTPEWIWPTFIGPRNDVAAITQFRTKNIAGTSVVDHHFDPSDNEHGFLGRDACRWLEIWTKYLNVGASAKVGQLNIGDVIVITPARILQNVLADAEIITSGQFLLARMPRGDAGKYIRGYGVDFDPMYVSIPAADLPAHTHSGQTISPDIVNCNTMSIATSCNRQYFHPGTKQCSHAHSEHTGIGADDHHAQVHNHAGEALSPNSIAVNTLSVAVSVNCANWVKSGDYIFGNDLRITEAEKLGFRKGLAFLNSRGRVLMVLDSQGNLKVAGKIQKLRGKRGRAA